MITDQAEKLTHYDRIIQTGRELLAAEAERATIRTSLAIVDKRIRELTKISKQLTADAIEDRPLFDHLPVVVTPASVDQPPGLVAGENLGAVLGCMANRVPTSPGDPESWRLERIANIFEEPVAKLMTSDYEMETLDDLHAALSDGHSLEDLSFSAVEAKSIRESMARFRSTKGWGPSDGIPEAWLAVETTEPETAQPTVKASDEFLLVRALHSIEGAEDRWASFRRLGATDEQLADQVGVEWKGDPSHSNRLDSYSCKGGKKPAIWINTFTYEPPTLTGKKLIAKVREVLTIPPVEVTAFARVENIRAQQADIDVVIRNAAGVARLWDAHREIGATEGQIRDTLPFGTGQVVSKTIEYDDRKLSYSYRGGRKPALWVGWHRGETTGQDPTPTFSGSRLYQEVRRVLGIPEAKANPPSREHRAKPKGPASHTKTARAAAIA